MNERRLWLDAADERPTLRDRLSGWLRLVLVLAPICLAFNFFPASPSFYLLLAAALILARPLVYSHAHFRWWGRVWTRQMAPAVRELEARAREAEALLAQKGISASHFGRGSQN